MPRAAKPPRHHAAIVLAACLGLAACSGESPPIGGTSSIAGNTGLSSETAATASAFNDARPSTESGAFNPFADPTATAPGGREVIAAPTSADVMATGTLPDMSLGRADAPVTIVQYASLTCPHCRHFHETTFPQLKRELIDTGKVRFILREFPIGKQSGNATIALRCARPEKYFELYGKFMTQQASWVSQEVRLDPIFAVARQAGLTRAEFDACLNNAALVDGLKWVKERGRKLGIVGTPNFFIGNQLIKKELTMDEIRTMVANPGATASSAPR